MSNTLKVMVKRPISRWTRLKYQITPTIGLTRAGNEIASVVKHTGRIEVKVDPEGLYIRDKKVSASTILGERLSALGVENFQLETVTPNEIKSAIKTILNTAPQKLGPRLRRYNIEADIIFPGTKSPDSFSFFKILKEMDSNLYQRIDEVDLGFEIGDLLEITDFVKKPAEIGAAIGVLPGAIGGIIYNLKPLAEIFGTTAFFLFTPVGPFVSMVFVGLAALAFAIFGAGIGMLVGGITFGVIGGAIAIPCALVTSLVIILQTVINFVKKTKERIQYPFRFLQLVRFNKLNSDKLSPKIYKKTARILLMLSPETFSKLFSGWDANKQKEIINAMRSWRNDLMEE